MFFLLIKRINKYKTNANKTDVIFPKNEFKKLGLSVPVYSFIHPTDTSVALFSFNKFIKNNDKKIINIGLNFISSNIIMETVHKYNSKYSNMTEEEIKQAKREVVNEWYKNIPVEQKKKYIPKYEYRMKLPHANDLYN